MTKEIPLTQGKIAIVDDEDYPELSKHKWYADKWGNIHYAVRMSSLDSHTHKRSLICMHAEIVDTPEGMETDHINGNGLDNRRENLRIVTKRQNQQNQHVQKSSKYPGVVWIKQRGKWRAYMRINKKQYHLGYYDDEETAGIIYAMACNALNMGCVL